MLADSEYIHTTVCTMSEAVRHGGEASPQRQTAFETVQSVVWV